MIHLRNQNDLLRDVRFRMRDTGGARWEDSEIFFAINSGIRRWAERVLVPFRYDYGDIDGYALTLPNYINPEFIRLSVEDLNYANLDIDYLSDSETYSLLPGSIVEVDTSGNRVVRLKSIPYALDLRVYFWLSNGEMPWDTVDLNAEIDADDTSLTVDVTSSTMPYVSECGYVYIDNEWIQYRGITRGTSQITLNNLIRGFYSTTASTHTVDTTVYWGLAADRADLFDQLFYHVRAELHGLFLTDGSESEMEKHEFAMRYWQQLADEYWKSGYVSSWSPRVTIEVPEL